MVANSKRSTRNLLESFLGIFKTSNLEEALAVAKPNCRLEKELNKNDFKLRSVDAQLFLMKGIKVAHCPSTRAKVVRAVG